MGEKLPGEIPARRIRERSPRKVKNQRSQKSQKSQIPNLLRHPKIRKKLEVRPKKSDTREFLSFRGFHAAVDGKGSSEANTETPEARTTALASANIPGNPDRTPRFRAQFPP